MSPLSMWKAMENGKVNVDYLEHLPEEFRVEADQLVEDLEDAYNDEALIIECLFTNVMKDVVHDEKIRRNIGVYCKEKKINSAVIFATLDKKDDVIDKLIMKQIRPKNNQIGE